MAFAYECCKANRGAAGVDGQTFEDIEEYGLKKWLDELAQELKLGARTDLLPLSRAKTSFAAKNGAMFSLRTLGTRHRNPTIVLKTSAPTAFPESIYTY